jgi:hypothetical protein
MNEASPVITFHPRLDLLATALAEISLAGKIADQNGVKPVWIPYPYDLGFRSGKTRIKSAVTTYFENEYVDILSDSNVGAQPLNMVKRFIQG